MNLTQHFTLEQASWPVLLVDSRGVVVRANPAGIEAFGPHLGEGTVKLGVVWGTENFTSADHFLSQATKEQPLTTCATFRLKNGTSKAFQLAASAWADGERRVIVIQCLPAGDTGTTVFHRVDQSSAHKQKLDCALQLARTVALDFNNALTSVLGHASLLLSKAGTDHPWHASLAEIEKSAARAAEVANDLGAFSRQDKDPRTQSAGNVNDLLERSVHAVQQQPAPSAIEWQFQLEKRVYGARFDEAKLQQAFLKVLENAVQALAAGGRVTVQTRNVDLTAATKDRQAKLSPGSYVCVEITDNGAGIAAEAFPRVFEPFFTTKEGHRGLGLAWAYGILSNHGGAIALSSEPGIGTSVRLYLPAEPKVVHEQEAVNDADLTGKATVLIVDDEDLLLTLGQTILGGYGYTVLTANSGQKALDILKAQNPPVDLVITDLVMPAMSGRELTQHVRRLSPQTRILCTSGFVRPTDQEIAPAYLQKPFTSRDLLIKVKNALAS
jgi:two-component system cell cycle sensor histidine kinase/response regulator CckA